MERDRFVVPETKRIDLSAGDWIEVKQRLTYGEQQRAANAAFGRIGNLVKGQQPEIGLDMEQYSVERMAIWLVDWSLRDRQKRPVKLTRAAIRELDPDTAAEIDAALDAHVGEALSDDPKR